MDIGIGLGIVFLTGTVAASLSFTGSLSIEHGSSGPQFTLVVLNNPGTNPYDGFAEVTDPDNVSTLSVDEVTISGALGAHSVTYKATSSGGRPDLTIALTVTIVDTTAPALSNPTDTQTGQTTATLTVDTDTGEGTLYAVATTSSTAPTAAQVMAGQDHTGAAASYAGSASVVSTGTKSFSATGLVASTAYTGFFVQKDASNNVSAVAHGDGFMTASASNGNDANTLLLLHCDATPFVDSAIGGSAPHSITAGGGGGTSLDTSIKEFGAGSVFFNYNGGPGFNVTSGNSDFAFGTGDFTVDFWFGNFINDNGGAIAADVLYSQWDGSNTGFEILLNRTTDNAHGQILVGVGGSTVITGASVPAGNSPPTWQHVALVRHGGTTVLYQGGVSQGSFSDANSYSTSATKPTIGSEASWQFPRGIAAWMDEIRVSNTARWTANFTPPVAAYS